MSDPIATMANQAENPQPVDGGGMFQGPDGRPSLRRIIATVLIVWGAVLETAGQFQPGDLIPRIAPGGVLIIAGLILLGILSVPVIVSAIQAAKGGK